MPPDFPAPGAIGADVAYLHLLLAQAGFVVPQPERDRHLFGKGTTAALRKLQASHALPVTGLIDPPTADALHWDPAAVARFTLAGRVTNRDSGAGLGGLTVHAAEVRDAGADDLGTARTADDGSFAFRLMPPGQIDDRRRRWAHVTVTDATDSALFEADVPVGLDAPLALAVSPPSSDPGVAAAAESAHVSIRPELAAFLDTRQIRTLGDVRRAGGLAPADGLPVKPDDPAVRALDALAALGPLPGDLRTHAMLLAAGYEGPVDIARTPEATFRASLTDVPAEALAAIYPAAVDQASLLTRLVARAHLGTDSGAPLLALDRALGRVCGCPDCLDASSPMAYLADLLDYAVRHLRENGSPLTIVRLDERFHQPFSGLPADCDALDAPVHQARIAIEVFRAYFSITAAPSWYPTFVYETLLGRLGTSTAELRDARIALDDVRAALGARLGVPVNPGKLGARSPDALDTLFEPIAQGNLTEATLEGLFGFRNTTRDPLNADPLQASAMYVFRRNAMRRLWDQEDWPVAPPPGVRPLIDPDQLDPADFADTGSPAYALWSQRLAWMETRIRVKLDERAQFGLDAMLHDLPVSGLNQSFGVADFLSTRAQQRAGSSIAATLAALQLDQAQFQRLADIVEVSQAAGATVLDSEWVELCTILASVEKRRMFQAWRAEERTAPASLGAVPAGYFPLGLTTKYFRLRPTPLAGGTEWQPKEWRSDPAARFAWVRTLRTRTDREQALIPALHQVVFAAEEVTLAGLRDWLVAMTALPTGLTRADWLTRHLQIDAAAGTCDVTTRISQAIATVQGILFGARTGLLEDETITLDAPDFDEEWQWIGSYATWRAAMLLYLYPETALQPNHRRRRSPAFDDMVAGLQAIDGAVDAVAAGQAAVAYARYFDDVCSLEPASVRIARRKVDPTAPAFFGADILAFARGQSGSVYMSGLSCVLREQFTGPPFLYSVDDQTYWEPIAPVPLGSEVAGLVPYRLDVASPRLALYGRHVVDGTPSLFETTYDGTSWSDPVTTVSQLPGVVRSVEQRGVVPPDPLADTLPTPWTFRGDEWVLAADVDGDGRREIVVLAAAATGGQRAVAVLRERDTLFVTAWSGTIPAAWTPFLPGGPVVLRVTRTSWPYLAERILLGDPAGPSLALLGGTAEEPLTVIPLPGGPFGALTLSFGDVLFSAADLDGDGDSELAIVDYVTVTASDEIGHVQTVQATRVTVLTVGDGTLTLRDQETLPSQVADVSTPGVPDRWDTFRPLRLPGGAEGFIVRTSHQTYTAGGNPNELTPWVGFLTFNSLTNTIATIRVLPYFVTYPGGAQHFWSATDTFLPVELGSHPGAGPEILVTDPAAVETGILARDPGATGHPYRALWNSATMISQPALSAATPWGRTGTDRFFAADLDGDGVQEIVAVSAAGRIGVAGWNDTASRLELRWSADGHVPPPEGMAGTGWLLGSGDRFVVADVDGDGCEELVALSADGRIGLLRGPARPRSDLLSGAAKLRPQGVTLRTVEEKRSRSQLAARQSAIFDAYDNNLSTPQNLPYLDEAYCFVPVELGLRLARDGAYTAALDWFASVYDAIRPVAERKVARNLLLEEGPDAILARAPEWLRDPLNPHAIAAARPNSYTRFTILSIVRALLAAADEDFTAGTSESVPRAEERYIKVLELLGAPELQLRLPGCSDLIDRITLDVGDPVFVSLIGELYGVLGDVASFEALSAAVEEIEAVLQSGDELGARVAKAMQIALDARAQQPPALGTLVADSNETLRRASLAAFADPATSKLVTNLSSWAGYAGHAAYDGAWGAGLPLAGVHPMLRDRGYFGRDGAHLPGYYVHPSFTFCVPPNPEHTALRTHAEVNLRKIRTCRTIEGALTSLEPYAAPTAGLVVSDGRLPAAAPRVLQPVPYRYSVLAERAKQLVGLAAQIEASLLGVLERRDAAAYDELRARQDIALARAAVRLKDLQLDQANEASTLAGIQRDRAQLQLDRARKMYEDGYLKAQIDTTIAIVKVMVAVVAAIVATEGAAAGAVGGALAAGAANVGSAGGGLVSAIGGGQAELDGLLHQINLGKADVGIADAQVGIAQDGVLIAAQDRAISALRADDAEAVADFLARKFTGLRLYEWMSGVLQDVYRFFLQQATATARLAEAQLAFERQELPPPMIQADYWSRPKAMAALGDTKGLTGSARLLRDIYELDQYAFGTDQRKLQLSKTFSLARLDPLGLQQFQESGVIAFSTPLELYDRDFPGHYLRLIKRVRVSVIALIPPGEGIHATLSTTGPSRVVLGETFQTAVVLRGPESVALTSPTNSSGQFELDAQPELLVPFEHLGVDVSWQLVMPRAANQFDFSTIADVLLTVDYTALDSGTYREQVLAGLDRQVTYQRAFSFRNELVDQWFDLHNPGQSPNAGRAVFDTDASDFAPNVDDVRITNVTVYFSPAPGVDTAGWGMALATQLSFAPASGTPFAATASAQPVEGVVTTAGGRGNTPLWDPLVSGQGLAPFGRWEIDFGSGAQAVFDAGDVADLLFILEYEGMLPAWPVA